MYLVTLLDFPMAFSFFLGICVNYSQCFFTSYFFKVKLKEIDNNDNNDKYNNNRHISIEIINSKETETTWDQYRLLY